MDISTIYSARLRKIEKIRFKRERFNLPDGDFLDLDWSFCKEQTNRCIILLHGLEGSSDSLYIHGMTRLFNQNNFDVCAVNFRSCSGELNKTFGCYHSGKTDDIALVVSKILSQNKYKSLAMEGVSLGGNVALKYTGENQRKPKELKAVVAISTPCDLAGSSNNIMKPRNVVYAKHFQKSLTDKLQAKQQMFPDKISVDELKKIKNLKDFDNVYTAKAHDFEDAEDYYAKNSSLRFLKDINIPTLILNAENDSFLSEKSYPFDIADNNPNLFLEVPKYGGHVGFPTGEDVFYHEKRTLEFVLKYIQ